MNSKLLKLKKKELHQLRSALEECRPKVRPEGRWFRYQEDKPPFKWKEEWVVVNLRKFNHDPKLEQYAEELGEKIKQTKRDIKEEQDRLEKLEEKHGRKKILENE